MKVREGAEARGFEKVQGFLKLEDSRRCRVFRSCIEIDGRVMLLQIGASRLLNMVASMPLIQLTPQ